MSNKDSAAQVCIHCGHERKHCHPISGKCFYGYEPPYTNPGCGCKCSFSEAAASEPVYRTVEQLDGSVATFADTADSAAMEIDCSCGQRVPKDIVDAVLAKRDSAASEGVPERIFMQVDDAGPSLSLATWCQDRINESDIEYARVRASVDSAGLGPFDDSQPVLAALSRLMDDGDATDNQRRTARMALKELAKRSPVDEAAVRRAAEKIAQHLDPFAMLTL